MNKFRYKENKSLKKLNEEKTIIGLEWWWLDKNLTIKYLNNKYGWKDLNLIDFQENLQYLVNLRELKISNNYELELLDLSNCINLENLSLINNKIVKIKLPIQNNIKYLCIYNNYELKNINLEVLNPEYLKELTLSSNNKLELKTEMLSNFINLKEMYLSNSNCSGSLFHFKNLTKLKTLLINNTNIIPSFEYLNDDASIHLYSASPNDGKPINKFINRGWNILLGRDMDYDEEYIKVSEFKIKNPILIENSQIIIKIHEYLNEINKDKEWLDNYLIKEKENGIRFKAETESEKAKFFYSNYDRFNIIYTVFSEWIYFKNKVLNEYLNQKSNASLDYYIKLLRDEKGGEDHNSINEYIEHFHSFYL